MKKIILTGLLAAVLVNSGLLTAFGASVATTSNKNTDISVYANSQEVKKAINAYKAGDYLACISTLKEYTAQNEENPIAWYYLGNAYMNIALTNEANEAFDRVIKLNSTSKLTSYAIQAQLCMKNQRDCKYENFNPSEVKKLKDDPVKFISDYYDALMKKSVKSDDVIQIENLIKGAYPNNMHPSASTFVERERTNIKTTKINSGKS